MNCPDDNALNAYVEGLLHVDDREALRTHVLSCEICAELVGSGAREHFRVRPSGSNRATDEQVTRPAGEMPTPAGLGRLRRGEMVGRFVILEPIGEGGMGAVYRAYDEQLRREVAVKLLKGGGPGQQARILREAQALAQLSHPNVVSIYDVGDHGDVLFIAMEFVQGEDLRTWWRTASPTQAEIIEIMQQAGRGLAAAHAAGLVHRDFKPENVLLGSDGRVRVVDFGLARAARGEESDLAWAPAPIPSEETECAQTPAARSLLETPLTQAKVAVGTPAYMAPEQHQGSTADARADQYAYCVTTWEVLVGERPFSARNYEALVDAKTKAPDPAHCDRFVPRHLLDALARGLAPDPALRWQDMDSLLEHLARDPRRGRRRVAAGLGSAALVVGAFLGARAYRSPPAKCEDMGAHLDGVWDDARRAEVERALVSTGTGFAAETSNHVSARLDDYTQRWVQQRKDACEATHVRGEQSDSLLDLRMRCLDERLDAVGALVDVLAGADEQVLTHAIAAASSLPRLDRCADREALGAKVPLPDDPAVRAEVRRLESRLGQADAMRRAGKAQSALPLVEGLVDEVAAVGYPPLDARLAYDLGNMLAATGDADGGEQRLRAAYFLALEHDLDDRAADAATKLMYIVGYVAGRPDEGREWALHAQAWNRGRPDPVTRAIYLNSLGRLESRAGNYELSMELTQSALTLLEENVAPNDPRIGTVAQALGAVAQKLGRYDEAARHYERALSLQTAALGATHPMIGRTHNNIGTALRKQGDLDGARQSFERALKLGEAAFGPDHPDVAFALRNLGILARSQGRIDDARRHLERALTIFLGTSGPDHPNVADVHNSLGALASRVGRNADAREHHETALSIRRAALGADHPAVASSLTNLGDVAVDEGEFLEAVGHYARALEIKRAKLGEDSPELASTLAGLGAAKLELIPPQTDGLEMLARAHELVEVGSVPELHHEVCFRYALALWDNGDGKRDRERARIIAKEALTGFEALEGADERATRVRAWLATR